MPAVETVPTGALSLARFRWYLLARCISWSGNALTLVALPLLMFTLTGSAALTGLVTALEAVPYLALGLLAGALSDRWRRRRVLVVTGIGSGAAMATIPIAEACGILTVAQLLVVATVIAVLFVFSDAAGFGALPELVGTQRVASATGVLMSASTTVGIVGPAVGGVLAATAGPVTALGVDAVAYLLAALLVARLPWPGTATRTPAPLRAGVLMAEIREGLRFLRDVRAIRLLTAIGAAASVSAGAVLGLTVVKAVTDLGLSTTDGGIGILWTAAAVGALGGALLSGGAQRRLPVGLITLLALGVGVLAQLGWAGSTTWPAAVACMAVLQAAATLLIVNGIVVRQSLTPDRLQARVNTTARMIAWGGTPLGALLGGVLAQHLGTGTALTLCTAGSVGALTIACRCRIWRLPRLDVLRAGTHSDDVRRDSVDGVDGVDGA